jgi:VanZ family protein
MTGRIQFSFLKMAPMIIVMAAIFFFSHQPGDYFALPPLRGLDKVLHAIAYGVLAGTVILALPPAQEKHSLNRSAILAIAICLAYGISDEIHQLYIQGRCASLWDVVADLVGSSAVIGGWRRLRLKGR